MPDFNLADMSLAELRDLQKSVAKAISTFEVRQKAEAREKVEMLAKELGFTLAELAELEEPKRKRAPLTKTYRHPEHLVRHGSQAGLVCSPCRCRQRPRRAARLTCGNRCPMDRLAPFAVCEDREADPA